MLLKHLPPSNQYLVVAPLAVITALSLCWSGLIRLAHLEISSLLHSSLENLSSSVRRWWDWPQILYWTEVWALTWQFQNIHLVVFKAFLCSYSWLLLTWMLSCRKINVFLKSHFSFRHKKNCPLALYNTAFILPSIFISLPELAFQRHPHARCCHLNALQWVWCVCGDVQCLASCLKAKTLHFDLIRLKHFVPLDHRVSNMPFEKTVVEPWH